MTRTRRLRADETAEERVIHEAAGGHRPRRKPPGGIVSGDGQDSADTGHAPQLIEAAQRIVGVLQHGDAEHVIERAVPVRKSVQVAGGDADAVRPKLVDG